ncbi:MAG: sulfotransferase domain-containing protein [Halioglobus sp.]
MPTLPTRTRHYQNAVMNSVKWDAFVPRTDDIIITTSYKAGTTWMQGICAALVFQQPQPPVPQDELSPWFDSNFDPLDVVVDQIAQLQNRRYIKTHCPLDGVKFFEDVKYIFVGRDGRDVFMSMWNHWNNMTPEVISELNNAADFQGQELPSPGESVNDAFDEWLRRGSVEWEQDGYPFWSHLRHAQSWWDYRELPNILFVHFSDLLSDPDKEIRRISAYLDIPINEEIWPELLQGVTFKEMKANALKMAPGATHGTWKDNKNFFHKGTNRRWEGVFTQAQIAEYEQLAARQLTPELNRWLEYGASAITDR